MCPKSAFLCKTPCDTRCPSPKPHTPETGKKKPNHKQYFLAFWRARLHFPNSWCDHRLDAPKTSQKANKYPSFPCLFRQGAAGGLSGPDPAHPESRSILPRSPRHHGHSGCFQRDFLLCPQQPPTQVLSSGFFPFSPHPGHGKAPQVKGTSVGGKGHGQAVKHTDSGNQKRFELLQAGVSQEILRIWWARDRSALEPTPTSPLLLCMGMGGLSLGPRLGSGTLFFQLRWCRKSPQRAPGLRPRRGAGDGKAPVAVCLPARKLGSCHVPARNGHFWPFLQFKGKSAQARPLGRVGGGACSPPVPQFPQQPNRSLCVHGGSWGAVCMGGCPCTPQHPNVWGSDPLPANITISSQGADQTQLEAQGIGTVTHGNTKQR